MEEPTREIHPFSYSSAISNETTEGNPMYGVEGESVSFGRFTSESLSWEKWSTFNRNRYVEEAEKYSKPGSVKQKKAFLEAHFKRMTTLKDDATDSPDQANTIQEAPIEPNADDTPVRNNHNELHPQEMILSSPPPSINDQQWIEKEVEIVDFGVDQNEDEALKTDLIDVEKQNPVAETESGLIKTQESSIINQENSEPALRKRNPPLSSYIPSVEAGTSLISSSTPAKPGIQSPAVHPVKEMDKKPWMDDQNKKRSPSLYKLINRKLGRLIGISSKASKNSRLKTPPKEKSKDRLCQVFICGSKLQSKSFQEGRETESSNI